MLVIEQRPMNQAGERPIARAFSGAPRLHKCNAEDGAEGILLAAADWLMRAESQLMNIEKRGKPESEN